MVSVYQMKALDFNFPNLFEKMIFTASYLHIPNFEKYYQIDALLVYYQDDASARSWKKKEFAKGNKNLIVDWQS